MGERNHQFDMEELVFSRWVRAQGPEVQPLRKVVDIRKGGPTVAYKYMGPKIAVVGSNKSECKIHVLHSTRTLMLETGAMSLFWISTFSRCPRMQKNGGILFEALRHHS